MCVVGHLQATVQTNAEDDVIHDDPLNEFRTQAAYAPHMQAMLNDMLCVFAT
jgi:hypothetical protein